MYREATRFHFILVLSIVIALTFTFLPVKPALSETKLELVFGVYTTDKPTEMVKTFRPVLSAIEEDISQKLGTPVSIRMNISRTYEQGVAALVNGEVDFARLGPASYIAASQQNPGIKILALDSKNREQTTKGIICVHENSRFQKIGDLQNSRFAFGNENSTIGRYLSQAYLLKHGIASDSLEHHEYLERHDLVAHAVAIGRFDAGALKESTFRKLVQKGLPLRALAQFPNVNKPWVASADMNEQMVNNLRSVLLNLSSPEAFKALGRNQFVKGHDSDFTDTRTAINNNHAFFATTSKVKTATSDEQ